MTGTAYVTSGTISWSKKGEKGNYTASFVTPDSIFGTMPERPDPNDPNVVKIDTNDATIYTVTTKNDDGSITETIYTFREAAVSLTTFEQKQAAWDALAASTGKSIDQLQAEGYTISDIKFDSVTESSWTVETRTRKTETTKETLDQTLVDDTWTLTGTTLTTKDGKTYKNLKKNSDGTYTATKEDGDKTITYTFTLGEEKDLDEPTIKAMLAAKFPESNGQITLDTTAKTATYKVGETTVTIDYSNLSKKTLKIDTSVSEAVSVTDTIKTDQDLKDAQERLYQELKKKVESIKLQEGEELRIGDLQITDIGKQKEEIIKHFTTAVSHENMSKDELIKALQEQERIAKNSTYVANAGSKYEETKKNYYSGEKTGEFKYFSKAPDGSKIEVYWKSQWWGGYYYYTDANGQEVPVHINTVHSEEQRDDIKHLDLASDSKLNLLPDEDGKVDQTDCVLVSKNLKLEWNYDAGNLVNGKDNQPVGLDSKISWDDEGGEGDGHYEYDRGNPNNCPDKSAYYKLTGTVAYDPIKENGNIKLYQGGFDDYWYWVSAEDQAINAYLKATGSNKTAANLSKKERDAIVGTYVVRIGTTGTNSTGKSGYQVYLKTSELTAYGYMSRDANTCINSTYKRQDGTWDYVGGYDLMISDLVQVSEGKVVGQTQSDIKTLWAPLAVRSTQSLENKSLQLDAKHTSTPEVKTENLGSGCEEKGTFTYNVSYEHTDKYANHCSQGVKGTGTGKYKTFTQLLKEKFSGKGETSYDTGSISYTYRTTENVDTTALTKETKNTTTAKATYNFTTVARKNFTVTTPADPEEPTPPQEEEVETPETPETPQTPELPPVQDATPEEPAAPAAPELPAVESAAALPKTGVNWIAALGMALSGMVLTIAGAFASLKYKEKH